MKVFAKFDEIPSMILQDIKETKRYRHKVGRTVRLLADNVETVYSPTNTVVGGGGGNNYVEALFCNGFTSHQQLRSYRDGYV